jgi:disulfide bond formation protein DsbB
MIGRGLSPELARTINFLGMFGLIVMIVAANIYQFHYHELPCTLCLLQRLAMIGVATGAAMNLVLGPDPRHYGVCLVSAILGMCVSFRQTLLHINPFFDKATGMPTLDATANPAFGQPVLDVDLYVWGILLFVTIILLVGIVLLFRGRFEPAKPEPQWLSRLATIGVVSLFAVAALQGVSVFLECGLGDCPNNGDWNWWTLR